MSLKDLKDAMSEGKVSFGIRQVLKSLKGKKKKKVFVAKDTREDVLKKLEEREVNFEFLKTKKEISKELELDFESEVFMMD